MKPRMMLLLPAIFYLLIQDFFRVGKAAYNYGALILNNGETLEINTTAPSISKIGCNNCSFNASLERRPSLHDQDYDVANITFSGNIEFKSGSTVKVSGKNALSLTSQNGHILVETEINMTCDEKVLDTTCLGGFTQSSTPEKVGRPNPNTDLYKGLGPGGLSIKRADFVAGTTCIPGSSHGGKASSSFYLFVESGPEYDKKNITSLLGGSGGSCLNSPGSVAGGGAIELVAEKGQITIDASVTASAQRDPETSKVCSGGSGGLVRLKALRVDIHENGRLTVNGGDSQQPSHFYHLHGGAGGIIQIISPEGSLVPGSSLLSYGAPSPSDNCQMNDNATGYFYLPGESSGRHKTFPNGAFQWCQSSSSTISPCFPSATVQQTSASTIDKLPVAPTVSASATDKLPVAPTVSGRNTKEKLKLLIAELDRINTSLSNGSNVNRTEIREVLSSHKSLADNVTFTKDTQDLCGNIFEKYNAIMDFVAERDPAFVRETLKDILGVASHCIHEKNHAIWREIRKMPELMQTLENIINVTLRGDSASEINYTLNTTNAVAQVVRKRFTSQLGAITIPDYSEIKDDKWSKVVNFVLIPRQKITKAEGNYTYVILLYRDVENGLPNNTGTNKTEEDWKVSSFVMSCFYMLDGKPMRQLSPPAILTFSTSAVENYEKDCFYWDINQSLWSSDGVQELKFSSSLTHTVCQTEHFTSFAVLIQHKKVPLSKADKLALSIITYIGCGVSTAALIITLIILLSLESLSSERHKIHTNLVFSLLLAEVLFLAGIQETSSPIICKIIAVFLHYFFLTAFTWMLVEGLHLYLKVVQVFNVENVKVLYYYVFGWGFSIIPVVITVAVRPDSYGNTEICWLSIQDGTVWAFIGPVIAIIAINCFVLFMVIKTVVVSASAVKNSEHAHIKAGIKGLFVLMPILGVGWILGVFALNESTIVFEYAFAIVNGFQGLLIFLLHCAFNNEVRQAFRRQKEKNALSKENDSQYHASFSLSKSEDSGSKKLSSSDTFKARASFKKKKTTKFVQVQPLSGNQDVRESSIQVKRTFQGRSPGKLAVMDIGNEISSLNCPILKDEARAPPKITHLRSQRTTAARKHSGH